MPQNILLVDDAKIFREVLTEILSDCGHKVTQAEDGKAATELLLTQFSPDFVITDLHMPHMSGLELAREIRTKYSMPIILCSSDDNAKSLCKGISNIQVTDKTEKGIQKIISHLSHWSYS